MDKKHQYNTRHKRKNTQPHASYYVGYVEDGESVESIMKKFETLAAIKAKKQPTAVTTEKKTGKSSKAEISDSDNEDEDFDIKSNDNANNDGLNDEELAQLFQQTSMFSVASAMHNNDIFMDKPIVDEEGFVTGYETNVRNSELITSADYLDITTELAENTNYDEYHPSDSEANESDFFEELEQETSRKRGKAKARGMRVIGKRRPAGVRNAPTKDQEAMGMAEIDKHYAYTYGRRLAPLVAGDAERRKRALKLRTCSERYCLKIPKFPMPQSWGHRIQRFNGHIHTMGYNEAGIARAKKELMAFNYIEHDDLSKLKATDVPHQKYHAVLIDAPWDISHSVFNPKEGLLKWDALKTLPLADVVENGMLFVWIPSELLQSVVRMIELDWGFRYVEHATFGKKGITNQFRVRKGQLMNYSKENLLLFRKGTKKKFVGTVELRHQRTSDTHFNFARYHNKYKRMELKPREFAFTMIETMLPDATQHIRDAIRNKTDLRKAESRLLYLWAPQYEHRGGWTMMVDKKQCEYLQKVEDDPNYDAGYYDFQKYY